MKRCRYLLLLGLATLSFSTVVFGSDFYILDLKHGRMETYTDDASTFAEYTRANTDNVAHIAPDGPYLIYYLPFKAKEQGALFITEPAGRPTKRFELGYARFVKAESPDQRHFLVSYRADKEASRYELAYYGADTGELSRVSLNSLNTVYDIKFAATDNTAYVLGLDNEKRHCILSFSLRPFGLKAKMNIGSLPIPQDEFSNLTNHSELFVLNNHRVVVINYGGRNPVDPMKTLTGGYVLFDTNQAAVIEEHTLPSEVYSQWFPKSKTLIIAGRDARGDLYRLAWDGQGVFIRINSQGVRSFTTPLWWNYQYREDSDCLYYLTNHQFGIGCFAEGKKEQWGVGKNVYTRIVSNWVPSYPDALHIIEDCKMALCWNPSSGQVRFIDLVQKRVVGKLFGHRFQRKTLQNYDGKTIISGNALGSRFYLLKTAKLLQVLDGHLATIATLKLPDDAIGMYAVDSNPLIIAKRQVYQIQDDDLIPIYQFKRKIHDAYLLRNGREYIVLTDGEMLRLESSKLKVVPMIDLEWPLDPKMLVIDGHQKAKLMHLPVHRSRGK